MTDPTASLLKAALAYAHAGFAVLPCEPSTKQPCGGLVPKDVGPDRKPIKGSGGLKKASRDPEVIRKWWACGPDAMIGLATGAPSGFWAIDLDSPAHGGRDGLAEWARLASQHGGVPETIEIYTPSGGRHLWLKYDSAHPLTNREGRLSGLGINVRGSGGYVIAPPSVRLDGKRYTATRPFSRDAISAAPAWIYEMLSPQARKTADTRDSAFFPSPENRARLVSALSAIPADDRTIWLRVGAALNTLEPEWGVEARNIWDDWALNSAKYHGGDQDATWEGFDPARSNGATIATIFFEAAARGWKEPRPELSEGVALEDFRAYMPMHNYIFELDGSLWPASSVNSRLLPVEVPGKAKSGAPKTTPASSWIDKNRPVEQMTWAPGKPKIIADYLMADGSWIARKGCSTFNLYRPPAIIRGDARAATRWVDLVNAIYPSEAAHIMRRSLALSAAGSGVARRTVCTCSPLRYSRNSR